MLKEVVSDLDNDLISGDSFESFTFPWEIAMNTLRHQEDLLVKDLNTNPSLPSPMSGPK